MKATKDIILGAKYLSVSEVAQLMDDLFMEFDPKMVYAKGRHRMPQFAHIVWYVRNYTYAPYTLIGELASLSKRAGQAYNMAECVTDLQLREGVKTLSLCGELRTDLELMRSIGELYGLRNNVPLELIASEEIEDALLYGAHCYMSGWKDKGRAQGGGNVAVNYRHTPEKEPELVTLLDQYTQLEAGVDALEIVLNRNYN